MITKKDLDNTEPSGAGLMTMQSVNHATEANRPLLTINYTVPGNFFAIL